MHAVLWDYEAGNDDELTVKQGEIVTLVESDDPELKDKVNCF